MSRISDRECCYSWWEDNVRKIPAILVALAFAACASPDRPLEVQPLVDAAWLLENVDAVVTLDIRQDRPEAAYATAHIPGAVHSPYGTDPWRVTQDGVPGMMPRVQDLELLIGALGISNDDYVVIVPAGASAVEFGSATRVYWQFKVLGHEKVAILNGGFGAWTQAGYATEAGATRRPPATYTANLQPRLIASKEDVVAALESGTPLIDARSGNYYRGEVKSRASERHGTIAGAKHVPPEMMTVGNRGVLVDSAAVASLWNEAGVPLEGEQITFCNIGHLASLAWFASYEVLGNKEARLYDGSMVEWSADPELPMDNTDNPDRE